MQTEGLFLSRLVRDYAAMNTALHQIYCTAQAEPAERSDRRTYSLVETASILGMPLSQLKETLEKHALHAEQGRRGKRISRREVCDYALHHPTRAAGAARRAI